MYVCGYILVYTCVGVDVDEVYCVCEHVLIRLTALNLCKDVKWKYTYVLFCI
jgi:hypothetical protein